MKSLLIILALATGVTAPALAKEPVPAVPVVVGDVPEHDACGQWGRIEGLNPKGDGYVSVRTAPTTRAAEVTRLKNDDGVFICDVSEDGEWIGVVYDDPQHGDDFCNVSSPVDHLQPYSGPCQSGWVYSKYVNAIAG